MGFLKKDADPKPGSASLYDPDVGVRAAPSMVSVEGRLKLVEEWIRRLDHGYGRNLVEGAINDVRVLKKTVADLVDWRDSLKDEHGRDVALLTHQKRLPYLLEQIQLLREEVNKIRARDPIEAEFEAAGQDDIQKDMDDLVSIAKSIAKRAQLRLQASAAGTHKGEQ
jgi:hypothetical protein